MKAVLAALVLAVCCAGAAASFLLDAPVREAVVAGQGKKWKKGGEAQLHGWVRRVGDWPWLMAGGAAGFVLAWRLGRGKWMRIMAAAMIASTAAGAIANMSRLTTGRTRPRAGSDIAQGFYGPWHEGRLLVGNSKYNSFPSGHTATAFGFAWPVVFGSRLFGPVALAGALVIVWSSIALGAHHPSDIVVSVLVSLGVAWVVWRWVNVRGPAAGAWILGRLRLLRRGRP
jgi:membrane-associated phospholipid phosphatase